MTSYGSKKLNEICITGVASTVLHLLGTEPAENMAEPIDQVLRKAEEHFADKEKNEAGICDRMFVYNPDAIAMWIYEKYAAWFQPAEERSDLKLEMLSVFPSVTPVCFASMYSGLLPEGHGIREYVKPVLTCRTIFDELPKSGRKTAIVSTERDSVSLIFLERDVDYYIYKTVAECNEKARQLVEEDNYHCIILYNTNYDHWLHRNSPEGELTLQALRENIDTYCEFRDLIAEKWTDHRTALAFAPDHGCHYVDGGKGDHGTAEPCDMNIIHLWSFI